jgi:hypothetical protein
MSINLSNTTPAAPSGGTNILWQSDGSGNVSGYVQSAVELVGDGVDLTAQTADIGPNTLVTTPNGYYRISAYLIVTTVDGASSTLPKLTITWNDLDNGQTQTFDLTPTISGAGSNLLTTFEQSDMIVSAGSSATLDYATSGYASGTPATMQYAIHIRVEQL